jgi:predicted transcriptional regulator
VKKQFQEKLKDKLKKARAKYLEQYVSKKEDAILEIIRISTIRGGISHKQLAQIADLDRKSLRKYTQHLMKNGKIRRDGIYGKYFLTDEAYKDPLLNATLFGDKFRFTLLGKKENLVLCNQIITDFVLKKQIDCTTYTRLYKPMFTNKDSLEHALFEFSNRVGAFIIYALIQAMNPNNNKMSLSTKAQDEIVKKWADNCISAILPFLLNSFNNFVYMAIHQYPSDPDKEDNGFIHKSPKLVLKESTITEQLTAFRRLYPRLDYELNEMIVEMPKALENHKEYVKELRKRQKRQQSCEHVYEKPPTMTVYGYYGKQCSKCLYIKRVKDPDRSQKS